MQVQVLFFATARERAGVHALAIELPAGSRVSDALDALVATRPALASLRPHLATAVNGALVHAGDVLSDGAELALLPPVSGG